ncbi:response regulator [Paenibacillus sp. 1P07SE]|uniref:response regulator n=1 Tax=Paenibacillus sp. 1P07SE TaxID=3132209 RepID=UPI0039A573EF
MIKVVIVDDEKMIREGLRSIMPWHELGYDVVATAANGREGVEQYLAYQPELMIVDIRMPGMDGLELIEAVRALGGAVRFLILSGYADFEYAKRAIKLQTDGYLLKPVDEDELQQHLMKLRDTLEAEAAERARTDAPKSRELLFRELLEGTAELTQTAEDELDWPSGRILLLRLADVSQESGELQAIVMSRLAQVVEQDQRGYVFAHQHELVIALKDASELDQARLLLQQAMQDLSAPWVAAAGRIVKGPGAWPASYADAQSLLGEAFRHAGRQILAEGAQPQMPDWLPREGEQPESAAALADKVYYAADAGNMEAAQRMLAGVGWSWLAAGISEQELKTRLVQAASTVIHRLVQHRPELTREPGDYASELLQAYQVSHFSDLVASVMLALEKVVSRLDQGSSDQQIKRLIDFIHRNYNQQLRLEMLAEIFNYNSAYLGKLFKSKTGEYFNTYLDKVRIEHAKAMLEEGMKVYQVADRVGYLNADYFHTKFKKYVGISPTGFRKR